MRSGLVTAGAALLLTACASTGGVKDPADPYEGFNRRVYTINQAIDNATLKPIAKTYKAVTPDVARRGVDNFLGHIEEPWSGVNALAQAKPKRFFRALDRLIINTLFGFGGLADRATEWGLPAQSEDLGQTLAVWGVPDGPFLMLPLFGPSNPRDAFGLGVQFFYDPKEYAIKGTGVSGLSEIELGVRILNFRTGLLDTADVLIDTSSDPYAALRSAYRQQRAFDINDGEISDASPVNDIFEDDAQPPETPPPADPPGHPRAPIARLP